MSPEPPAPRTAPPRTARSAHRLLGLALALPLFLWAATGFLFHWKPGWRAAYASLALPTRPIDATLALPSPPDGAAWLEARRLATALGEHLFVRDEKGWKHLDARTGEPFPEPDDAHLAALLDEALASDRPRYGTIESREEEGWRTTTGVRVTLDWTTLRLAQEGPDTRRIDRLYRIHYLQWAGVPAIDRPFAVVGLSGLVLLALVGLRLSRRGAVQARRRVE